MTVLHVGLGDECHARAEDQRRGRRGHEWLLRPALAKCQCMRYFTLSQFQLHWVGYICLVAASAYCFYAFYKSKVFKSRSVVQFVKNRQNWKDNTALFHVTVKGVNFPPKSRSPDQKPKACFVPKRITIRTTCSFFTSMLRFAPNVHV